MNARPSRPARRPWWSWPGAVAFTLTVAVGLAILIVAVAISIAEARASTSASQTASSLLAIALGAGWSAQYRGSGQVAVCFFGDGTTNIGAFHEALNMAVVWKAPVVFVCENNGYGEFTAIDDVTAGPSITGRGEVFGIPSRMIDGMNVRTVHTAAARAVAHARAGKGPYILEVKTYRYRGHSMSDPAKYRTREEVQKMREERDAIEHVRQLLLQGGHASEDDLKSIDKEIKDIVNDSADFARESPEPPLDELWTDIYADELPQQAAADANV